MTIRPVDIRRKEFKSGFRGYDPNEVDDFLDTVADEFERTFAENQRMSEEVASLKERLEQFEELETSIREALVHAQQVARDLRRNATKEAELIVREAKERSHQILADSSARVERVQESYEVLRRAKQEFANDFRHLLKSYIAVMDNVDVASAKEIEASLRERLDLESVAVAREAAEARRTTPEEERNERTAETGEVERQVETTATPIGRETEATNERGLEPEAEEPEVEPSSIESPVEQESASTEAADTSEPAGSGESEREQPMPTEESRAAEEVDREEPMAAGEDRVYDEFFDRGEARSEESGEERKIFRASRFLRRRG
jgi:cell division initiation protein